MATTPEGRVKARLKRRLKQEFGDKIYIFMPVQRGFGAAGLDFHCAFYGYHIAIETKADPSKTMTPRQEVVSKQMEAAGGRVFFVTSDEQIELTIACLHLMIMKRYNPVDVQAELNLWRASFPGSAEAVRRDALNMKRTPDANRSTPSPE